MDYEKKYNEAIKRAKQHCADYVVETIFPELKESEDERIRKAIVELVHDTTGDSLWVDYGVHKEDALAWLEKQGEHAAFRKGIQVGDQVTRNEDGVLFNLSQLKRVAKQGEQKSDKIICNPEACIYVKNHRDIQKPVEWSEEDKNHLDSIIDTLKDYIKDKQNMRALVGVTQDNISWLKSIKDRVQPQPKQEWSEEDENAIEVLMSIIKKSEMIDPLIYTDLLKEKLYDWLKSLRPQNTWKPSEGQLEALKKACDEHWEPDGLDPLYTLYQDLKKLRE